MKKDLNKIFTTTLVISSVVMALSLAACVLSAVLVIAKGNITLGVSMIVCFALMFIVSASVLGICLTWKRSKKILTKYNNDRPDFYEQKKIDENK